MLFEAHWRLFEGMCSWRSEAPIKNDRFWCFEIFDSYLLAYVCGMLPCSDCLRRVVRDRMLYAVPILIRVLLVGKY